MAWKHFHLCEVMVKIGMIDVFGESGNLCLVFSFVLLSVPISLQNKLFVPGVCGI